MKTKICFLAFVLIFLLVAVKASYAAVWPINNSITPDQITSDYGPRIVNGKPAFHYGIDLRANAQPVHAILGGSIVEIKIDDPKAGNLVTVADIRYLHLSKSSGSYEFRSNELGTYIVVNDQGVVIKVLFTRANEILEPGLPKSTNTLTEGEIFAYSGSSGTSVAYLHIDKLQPGPNPLRDLSYTGVASTIEGNRGRFYFLDNRINYDRLYPCQEQQG